jgi:hypothetical protein
MRQQKPSEELLGLEAKITTTTTTTTTTAVT